MKTSYHGTKETVELRTTFIDVNINLQIVGVFLFRQTFSFKLKICMYVS